MNGRRLIVYLMLNAIVSAAATLGVLWWWDRTHPAVVDTPALTLTATPSGPAMAANTPAPTPDGPALTAGPQPTPTLYTVKSGDSLGSIAEQFDVTVQAIMEANGLADPNLISAGQSLVIPVPGSVPPTAEPGSGAPAATEAIEPPRPTATGDPSAAAPRLTIREVQSAGVLADERLVILNSGGPVDLAGWSLRDESGHSYTFPALVLFEGGAVTVHTTAGTDTVTDLHWGQAEAVWASGKQVLLSDAAGNLHTRFAVP